MGEFDDTVGTESEQVDQPQTDKFSDTELLGNEEIREIIGNLDIERIRRAMMLFDLRWYDEAKTVAFIPNEDEIFQEALQLSGKTIIHSRMTNGYASLKNRGFKAISFVTPLKQEVLHIEYVLSEATNLPC